MVDTSLIAAVGGMAAEVMDELSKAEKRELKWERKQAKVKAAAEAAGQTYVPPSKAEKDAASNDSEKMGKRKKRKLAALQQESASDANANTDAEPAAVKGKKKKAPSEPLADGNSLPTPAASEAGTADQSKADRKAAKKAKKAAAADTSLDGPSATANGDTETPKPKKKNKKSSTETTTDSAQLSAPKATAAADSTPAEAPKKKSKKQQSSGSDAPQGRVRVQQEAVLASVGDKELAKSGKTIQKALYHEHSSVTAMSQEEVAKHQSDRDTVVTGADLRPVLQFDQAGRLCVSIGLHLS